FCYREKLSPQPQVRLALGLLNTKPAPLRPPEYSRVVPIRYRKLFLSTIILTPLSSNILSSSCWDLSNFKSYDNPEQPPLLTPTLIKSVAELKPSSFISSTTFFLAVSDTFIICNKNYV